MISMQYVLNPEIEGLSQILFIFLSNDMIVLIFGFIEVALRSDRLMLLNNSVKSLLLSSDPTNRCVGRNFLI